MTRVFLGAFAVLAVLSAIAFFWYPAHRHGTRLLWVSDNNPGRTSQIERFNREHPDRFLVLDYVNTGLQKIMLQSVSGVGPEIMDFGDQELQALVEAGVLLDVTEAAKEMGFSAVQDCWPEGAQAACLEGRQYAYPCNIGCNILVYNKNVFDFFGVPYPQGLMTMEEFIALGKKVCSPPGTDPAKRIYAVAEMTWRILFESLRGEFFTADGRPNLAGSPELKRALQMHKDLIFQYDLMPAMLESQAMSAQGGWGLGHLNQFAAGRYAMMVTGEWLLLAFERTYRHQMAALKAQGLQPEDISDPLARPLRLGAVLIPRFSDAPPCYRVNSRLAGINCRTPRTEEALAFLKFLAGPSYSSLINQQADYLPGNPRYVDLGIEPGPEALARLSMHDLTKQAVEVGYVPRRSPFLLTSDVVKQLGIFPTGGGVLGEQVSRMESNPNLSVEEILQAAQEQLETLLRRNLDRDPKLKELYQSRFGSAGVSEAKPRALSPNP